MGIVNLTPDSFSGDGLVGDVDRAIAHAREQFEAGADILDIGGESTRAGSDTVEDEEEVRRVIPVVEALSRKHRVSIDTRKIAQGDLFVALQGPNFDGHDYIEAALKAGAAGVIAHRLPENVAKDAPIVLATDTLQALQDLGRAARNRSNAKFVAVTGSVGKTSTKEALKVALGAQGKVFASEGNLNNHWGAPLSLARMPREIEIGIFELGMNHADEIRPLAKMVRPHAAIITTVGGSVERLRPTALPAPPSISTKAS